MNAVVNALNRLSPAWCEFTRHLSWQAALTAALLLLVATLGRRWPAPWRHWALAAGAAQVRHPAFPVRAIGSFQPTRPGGGHDGSKSPGANAGAGASAGPARCSVAGPERSRSVARNPLQENRAGGRLCQRGRHTGSPASGCGRCRIGTHSRHATAPSNGLAHAAAFGRHSWAVHLDWAQTASSAPRHP